MKIDQLTILKELRKLEEKASESNMKEVLKVLTFSKKNSVRKKISS